MKNGSAQKFLHGVATSAYQIEGAVQKDGRGASIWDVFSHTENKTHNGETGNAACEHYERWEEDVRLMQELGINAYRFSIAWPRIFPNGSGALNRKGLDFYKRLIDRLLEEGIEPLVTIYHWDLPQVLEERGGWLNRDTALRFAEYASVLFQELGDVVPAWITHNEPWCAAILGYGLGEHAPGKQDLSAALTAAHHLLLSHGRAVQAFRQANLKSAIGITNILTKAYPATDDPADRQAAVLFEGQQNRWFLDPLLKGSYPADLRAVFSQFNDFSCIQPGDMATIGTPIDFLGVNYYTRQIVRYDPTIPPLGMDLLQPEGATTAMGWEVAPDAFRELLLDIRDNYGEIPLLITENGAAFEDHMTTAGRIEDQERIAYLQKHLQAMEAAMQEGVPVRGYFAWSLLDNFEWSHGYSKRFGLVHVDYATQKRTPKDSYDWYREWVREHLKRD